MSANAHTLGAFLEFLENSPETGMEKDETMEQVIDGVRRAVKECQWEEVGESCSLPEEIQG